MLRNDSAITVSKKGIFYAIFGTLIIRLIYNIIFPYTNEDGPWYLNHAFSVMQGHFFEMSFSKEYMQSFTLPYMYGLFNSVLYYPFSNSNLLPYSIFFWNAVWIACFIFSSYLFLKATSDGLLKTLLVALAYISSTYTYSLRSEIFILPFLLLLSFCYKNLLETYSKKLYLICGLLIAIIGLMHPIGGIYSVFFVILNAVDEKGKVSILIKTGIVAFLCLLLLYLPVIIHYYQAWRVNFIEQGIQNQSRSVDGEKVMKFFALSFCFVAILFLLLISSYRKNIKAFWKESIYWIACISLLTVFGRSFYLIYLLHFMVWRLSKADLKIAFTFEKIVLFFSFVISLSLSYVWPVVQIGENPSFASTVRKSIDYVRSQQHEFEGKKIWVPGNISMSVIDNLNSRLHFNYYQSLTHSVPLLSTSDVLFINNYKDLNYIRNFQVQQGCKLNVIQILPTVKGLVTLSFPLKRCDSIGLWEIEVIGKSSNEIIRR